MWRFKGLGFVSQILLRAYPERFCVFSLAFSSQVFLAFKQDPDDRVFITSQLPEDGTLEMHPAQVQEPRTRKLPKGRR